MTARAARDATPGVRTSGGPGEPFDPYDYRFQEDPYPTYTRLREHEPLHHSEDYGFWALSRHADVAAALRDDVTYSSAMGVSLDPAAWGPHAHKTMSFLAMDPPRQARLRSLVSKGFTPRRVRELEPQVRRLTRKHLDAALGADGQESRRYDGRAGAPTWDFVDAFAGRLPMDVISELMGVPEEDRDEIRRLADLVVHREEGVRDVPAEGMEAALRLVGYYAGMLDERRKHPTEDLTSALMAAEADGDRLTDDEIIGFLFLLVVAGNETTTKLLANAVYHAHRHPERLADVLADPAEVPAWVEETLRFDSSTQILARHLTRDVELHGRVAPAGSQMLLLLGAANRDPRVFADPDGYDLGRDTGPMVSFGGGRHFCLGANLARLEARVALTELVQRVTSIEVHEQDAVRVHSVNVRGFASLPVSMGVR